MESPRAKLENNNVNRKVSTVSTVSGRSVNLTSDDEESLEELPDLETSLKEVLKAIKLFFANEYDEALAVCDKWAKHSAVHSLGKCFMRYLPALLTFEGPEIELAKMQVKSSLRLCEKQRKKSSMMKTLSSFFATPDYNSYTDEEAHVELIIAHCHTFYTQLTFFGDQSLLSLLKGAFRMRTANNGYKFCHEMLKKRKQWSSVQSKNDFESGVYTGLGMMGLILSHLPAKLLKLITMAGFGGDRNEAEIMLRKVSSSLKETHCNKPCEFVIILYNLYIEQSFGVGASDPGWAEALLNDALAKCPQEAFNLFFAARLNLLKGKSNQAIEYFNKSIEAQDKWKQIHYICYWDLCWCYAVQSDWETAIKYARILKENSKWSPATNMYQVACFLHMMMEETGNADLKPEILKAMQTVPELKIRFAGKTLPPEKFAVTKALRYINGDEDTTLPALELFYTWNIFGSCSSDQLQRFLGVIQDKLSKYERNVDDHIDGYCLCLLLKGVCLRLTGKQHEAIECYKQVISNETDIEKDTYIPPQAALELGLTYLEVNNYAEAKEWLEKARDKYTGFVAESLVHLRVHGALTKLFKKLEIEKNGK